MFHKILFSFRSTSAYWRSAPFSQIAELYSSHFLRIFAQNLVNVFVIIYLYQRGYSLTVICIILGLYFAYRIFWSYFSAHIIAWLGPKTSILLSNIIAIPALISLALIDEYSFVAIAFHYTFQGVSLTLLSNATDVQFSSIKNDKSVGKELGWLLVAEKVGAAAAPIVGGLLASRFGPQAIMWIASFIMVASIIPLLLSPENTRRKQRVTYHGFNWRSMRSQMISPTVRGADIVVSGALWSIFVAIVIFGTGSNTVYAQLGVLFSLSFTASIVASWLYGLLIDRNKSEKLLRFGGVLSALVHLVRPFISAPVSVGMLNVASEAGTSAYGMPTFRYQYDMVEKIPGYRTVYFSVVMMFLCAGASIFSFITALLVWWLGDVNGLKTAFGVMAGLIPLVILHGFKTLRTR